MLLDSSRAENGARARSVARARIGKARVRAATGLHITRRRAD